ncbi:ABC transporter ATP-binding protein [Romboutsia lituseburensis]|uniref:ABC transporter ATP-binding protein n=1 Tax=Romboutsia lituseburensis TaxID=1537 RepID=UPI00215B25EB|nr:dipeptide/oligopeptide/nickel ABC transporter ATP-binding protein [Romboutsia lituseburensis]MCR8747034.1 dipeptide/oligopeptide/nickel ABC transporter ATP-binding protein [Romboutsia lituseburensis]
MWLNVENLYKSYSKQKKIKNTYVLKDISFSIEKGECVGLIGESGSGKSTLSRLILGLEKMDSGSVNIEGKSIKNWIRHNKGKMSVVFQDYISSVNPNFTVKDIILEPLYELGNKYNLDYIIESLLEKVEFPLYLIYRYPHELSGGQLQRVCIARVISTKPEFIVLDEAISSLDVSIQVQILDLLKKLKKDLNITYLFITHDLQSVAYLCDRVLFLYKGEIVENIDSSNLSNVRNDYSKKLLSSVMPFSIV